MRGLAAVVTSNSVRARNGCLHWQGYVGPSGYGVVTVAGVRRRVHRAAYVAAHGPLAPGMTVDHTCHTTRCKKVGRACLHRRCVEPTHLKSATVRENTLRTNSAPAVNARKTHCPQNHEYSPENTGVHNGKRYCKACRREHARRYYRETNP